jgi:uncharacterized iron-regulated membrane protein
LSKSGSLSDSSTVVIIIVKGVRSPIVGLHILIFVAIDVDHPSFIFPANIRSRRG